MEHQSMSKEQIAQARALFGPAPILSSEQPELYESFFDQLTLCLQPQDFVEVMLIWHYAVDAWRVSRAIRHGTVAIERRYQEGVRQKLQRARLQQAQIKEQTTAQFRNQSPSDIAALAGLEREVLSTSDDIEELFKRKATEIDHNIAFERSMIFQEQLEKLVAGASRRRDDALQQLEIYRMGLGVQAREIASQLLDAEVQESAPAMIEGPSLVPAEEGAIIGEGTNHKEAVEKSA